MALSKPNITAKRLRELIEEEDRQRMKKLAASVDKPWKRQTELEYYKQELKEAQHYNNYLLMAQYYTVHVKRHLTDHEINALQYCNDHNINKGYVTLVKQYNKLMKKK